MEKKRIWKRFWFLVSLCLGCFFLWNMDASADYGEFRGTITMKVGEQRQFEALDGAPYSWGADDSGILLIEPYQDGKYAMVTAQKAGRTTLRVNSKRLEVNKPVPGAVMIVDRSDTWTIIVEEDVPKPTGMELNHSYLKLTTGSGCKLTYTLTPAGTAASVSFTSSNPGVASVDMQSGYVSAKSAGSAKITARTDNGIEKTCMVEVSPPAASDIKLNKKSLTVEQGKTKKLTATISPVGAAGKITWKSSNPKIASVKNGTVKGIRSGKATITARLSSKIYAECKVTVPIKPVSIKLDKKKLQLAIGQKYKLSYKLSPKGAKSEISWSSSKSEIASVSKSGNITAKKAGTTVITVKTLHGKKASCKVTVKAPQPTAIKLSAQNLAINIGTEKKLTYSLSPKKAQSKVTFTSSNTSVASVSTKGKITAKKKGKTTITAKTANGKKASCKVTVKIPAATAIRLNRTNITMSIRDKKKHQLTYQLVPAQAKDKVVFSSSDESIAQVDGKGLISAMWKEGTAVITARTESGKTASCKVTVKAVKAEVLELDEKELRLNRKERKYLSYRFMPEYSQEEEVFWSSSNPQVASVDGGQVATVTANEAGTAVITARSASGLTASCKVTVSIPEAESIFMYCSRLPLGIGATRQATYEIEPEGAADQVTWSSSNPNVASVDQNGLITANRAGMVEITVTTANGKSHTVELTVKQTEVEAFTISAGEQPFLKEGESLTMEARIYPSDTGKSVVWSVSDPSVAAITQDGVVKALKAGKTTVYASIGSLTESCEITVTKGTWIDISKGVKILEDRSARVNGSAIVPYDEENGFTFVQSDPKKGWTINIDSKEDIFITLAGISIEDGYLWMKDAGNVTLELAEGTENRIAYVSEYSLSAIVYGETYVYGFPAENGPYLTIQGKGKLILESSTSALSSTNIKIKSGEIIARTTSTEVPVIGSDTSTCANIYILNGAKVTAYGGCKAVGAPANYKEQNINIAEGSLTYFP